MVKKDISEMSLEEIQAYVKERKESEEREKHATALKAKAEVETYVQKKYGLSLREIFTVSETLPVRKQYKNPEDGSVYSYSGRGKVPSWLKGPDGKPNPKLQVPDVNAMIG